MFADIHSHIIPFVDDGAEDTQESIKILQMMAAQGITSVAATPHFYPNICPQPSIHAKVVAEQLEILQKNLPQGLPDIVLGHEVSYFRGISTSDDIVSLKMGKSQFFLLELPYENFAPRIEDEIMEFSLNTGFKIILAHVERYANFSWFPEILKIIKNGFALAQAGCDSIVDSRRSKNVLKLTQEGYISFIATDAHSSELRPPLMADAYDIIIKKFGSSLADTLKYNAESAISLM